MLSSLSLSSIEATAAIRIRKVCVKDIEQKNSLFFLLDQFSITLICVPSYDRSYNVYLFPIGL